MAIDNILFLSALIFAAAALYSSVGHGGASGYIAAMALFSLSPMEMKPAALTLNVFVASIGSFKYIKAGRFNSSLFWPFALASIPLAFIGGLINLPAIYYKPIVGLVLIYAAWYFMYQAKKIDYEIQSPPMITLLFIGGSLGFVSGLVGVGGGIFLSPLLIMLHWESVKNVSGIAAAFILVNSIAGLSGFVTSNTLVFPEGLIFWIIAAMVGGYLGAEYGSKHFDSPAIKRILALVLLIAGIKMLLTI